MSQNFFKILRYSLFAGAIIAIIVLWSVTLYFFAHSKGVLAGIEDSIDVEDYNCNVAGIKIHDGIVTYNSSDEKNAAEETSADQVYRAMEYVERNQNIKAVIVEIDSTGGSGVACEEIMTAFKKSKKPVVAFIRDVGSSAAYCIATGAQTIFASKMSDVGGIGVNGSYLENTDKNKMEGLKFIDIAAGKYKNYGNPDHALTDEEKQLMIRDVNLMYEYFIQIVAQNRKLDIGKVRKLADGSTMMGEAALKNGLIDQIGNLDDVKHYLQEIIGDEEEVDICWKK